MVAAQVFSGVAIGLLLGLLMGLSSAPVVALVVGAIAALLGGMVLPAGRARDDELPAPARLRAAAWRSGALSLAAIVGLLCGLWLRTHDALSPAAPTLAQQVAELQAAGFAADEARRLVAARRFPAAPASAAPATHRATVLFSGGSDACERLAPARFASVAAAATAYDAAGQPALARLARALGTGFSDEAQRRAALEAAVEATCAAR